MDEAMDQALFSKKKAAPVSNEDKTEEELVQEAVDIKLDSSVYTSEPSYLPKWSASYA